MTSDVEAEGLPANLAAAHGDCLRMQLVLLAMRLEEIRDTHTALIHAIIHETSRNACGGFVTEHYLHTQDLLVQQLEQTRATQRSLEFQIEHIRTALDRWNRTHAATTVNPTNETSTDIDNEMIHDVEN